MKNKFQKKAILKEAMGKGGMMMGGVGGMMKTDEMGGHGGSAKGAIKKGILAIRGKAC